MNFTLTPVSKNSKTGPMATSYTSAESCPSACPLKNGGGCYAELSYTGMHWRKVTSGLRGISFDRFIDAVRKLPKGSVMRHNVAGDLPGKGNTIDVPMLERLTKAVRYIRAFTYTHKPLTDENVKALRDANASGFTINVSTNSIDEVDDAMALSLPVVTIVPEDTPKVTYTSGGTKVVVCPAQTVDSNCLDCMLCHRSDRSYAIGFKVHGARRNKVLK